MRHYILVLDPVRPGRELHSDLSEADLYALAKLCKRLGSDDARRLSVDDDESRRIIAAAGKLRTAIESVGVVVR